ncbi:MAG: tRNA glutamyl-Q(34) synthetase GluQRS [Verrucomicrobiota bacterium]|nr:tRNA glutamyl-Q(34) synthetase GluQRS [Chthoniobacterales bacterium]MDQ3413663.1 tRNA glutamyl-Q(34) synthetase GluQRS [Verrucomicrobiota bacterium]
MQSKTPYCGRLAPSPTGYLHVGHAVTFWRAQERSRARNGKLFLRIEDLDRDRCRPEFRTAILEDLEWFGFQWEAEPVLQSERRPLYLAAWKQLRDRGLIYPCTCTRRDVLGAAGAPHAEDEEPIYPGTCRPADLTIPQHENPAGVTWRFRVPGAEAMQFHDHCAGPQRSVAGAEFGDFVVWRKDDVPAYQLAVVVDDATMQITEVVRGADLLRSTFRQLLLYRALALAPPEFCHLPLIVDSLGKRLAKRDDALSLRILRAAGLSPDEIRARYLSTPPSERRGGNRR